MDFDLSEDQSLLRDSIAKLLADTYSFEQRQALRAAPEGFSRELWARFAELGLIAVPFAESDGGLGGGPVEVMLVMEEFGRHLVLEPWLATAMLAGGCLRAAASPEQRAAWLPALLDGRSTWALAHVERSARYDLAHVRCVARRDGAGWRLDGDKACVLHGASAAQLVVSARDEAGVLQLFVVDGAAAGMTRRGYPTQDGLRAADVGLRGVFVPESARLASADALATLHAVTDAAIAATCAEAVGTMERALDITVEYLKQRKQFGVAIGSFQALQHRAVDMLVMLEQARSMSYFATMSTSEPDPVRRAAAMSAAKVQIGRSARFVGEQAVQLHGGIGITEECAVGHFYRRLTLLEILFGDGNHHLAALAAAGGLDGES